MRKSKRFWSKLFERWESGSTGHDRRVVPPGLKRLHFEPLEDRRLLTVVTLLGGDPAVEGLADLPCWFEFLRNDSDGDLEVNYEVTGGAINGEDYPFLSGKITIPDLWGQAMISEVAYYDGVPEPPETMTLTLTEGSYDIGEPSSITVTILDDTLPPAVWVAPTEIFTDESGTSATFAVNVDGDPSANVTIGFTNVDATEGTLSATNLIFTPLNAGSPQTVTVTGVDDSVVDWDQTYCITTTATSADPDYNNIAVDDVSVTNTDNDPAGVTVFPTSGLITTEAGDAATFTVVLNYEPEAAVTIALCSSDTTEGTVSSDTLFFTKDNWDTEQTVTVTGVSDSEPDGDMGYTIQIDCDSTDLKWDIVDPEDVSVTNRDARAGVTVAPTSGLRTTEAGGTADFTVVLDARPTANVTIGLLTSDTAEGTVSASSLTFTPDNWDTPQSVTVTGVDDSERDASPEVDYVIETTATSDDALYNLIAVEDVKVKNADDDLPVNSTRDLPDSDLNDGVPWTGTDLTDTDFMVGQHEVTLRAAIEQANANGAKQQNPGTHTIDFEIPTTDDGYNPDTEVYTIDTSGLPAITRPVSIRGNTQAGWVDQPVIELRGGSGSGLTIGAKAPGSSVRALAIYSFSGSGITIESNANTIQGCYLGTDALGAVNPGNSGNGIEILNASKNVVGGISDYVAERNLISGNADCGVFIWGPSAQNNQVKGNYIGTDLNGTSKLANDDGVFISGGASGNIIGSDSQAGGGNVISGNSGCGVHVSGSNTNYVYGNLIGVNKNGTVTLGNKLEGVLIDAGGQGNCVGISDGKGLENVVSGNQRSGVHLTGASTHDNVVAGNWLGTDKSGSSKLPNENDGVLIQGDCAILGNLV